MKLYQDAAGTIPATQPGHPVGLVVSQAGRINHSQPTALSKPTLARWPKGGRRNLANGAQSVSAGGFWASGSVIGVTVELVGSGYEDGVPYRDIRCFGTATGNDRVIYNSVNSYEGNFTSGEPFSATVTARRTAGSAPAAGGLRVQINEGSGMGAGYLRGSNSALVVGSEYQSVPITRITDGAGAQSIYSTIVIRMTTGDAIDVTYRVKGFQFERGAVQTPLQLNYNINDITEPGVKDLWHLYNDGGDSLNAVYPAGTYGVGYLSTDLVPTFTTVVSDGVTGISSLFTERQADVVIRPGEFTQADKDKIIESWGRI